MCSYRPVRAPEFAEPNAGWMGFRMARWVMGRTGGAGNAGGSGSSSGGFWPAWGIWNWIASRLSYGLLPAWARITICYCYELGKRAGRLAAWE
jgi:hypothetical protein